MDVHTGWQTALGLTALGLPVLLALTAVLTARAAPFRYAAVAGPLGLALTAVVVAGTVLVGGTAALTVGVRLGTLTSVMLLLVATLALVILRYSRTYMDGDAGAHRYMRWLLATLSAVSVLVIANNLLVLALAWIATSLALHQLLTFYDRPAALLAAHKKFLASRMADVCLIAGLVLVQGAVGSLDLDAIETWASTHADLPVSIQIAAFLFAAAACIKSAQLPLHGWLTQVMEAPTPVSALLHAGIVNIGGFLMIRLAPLMANAPGAQLFLVIVGLTTTVLAAAIMTTRVSIKVSLAWSTCAQMGFMLVQCGLGAWHLALLHLVAHSLYKAHAFLSSGSVVEAWRIDSIAPGPERPSAGRFAAATVVAFLVVGLEWSVLGLLGEGSDFPTGVLALIVALSLAPMYSRGLASGARTAALVGLMGLAVSVAYFAWHALAAEMLSLPTPKVLPHLGWTITGLGFLTLFLVQANVQLHPEGRFTRVLHRWLFAGLYLDERFTRLTFRVWPPRLRDTATNPTPTPQLRQASA